jgi:oligoribonuclease (3'-5' exoribonuclease)
MSRVTTKQVHDELKTFIDHNCKEHKQLHSRVSELGNAVKENRSFFTDRMDRLDNRIWMIMALTFTTFITLFASLMFT